MYNVYNKLYKIVEFLRNGYNKELELMKIDIREQLRKGVRVEQKYDVLDEIRNKYIETYEGFVDYIHGELLLSQYDYGHFDTSYNKELNNYINYMKAKYYIEV